MEPNPPFGRSRPQEDLPKGIKETLAKQRIEQNKKDFEEMLQRGEEAVEISKNLEKSFSHNKNLNSEDLKKLSQLENLVKKIRKELGGEDDDEFEAEEDDKPEDLVGAFKILQSNASKLLDELKKTSQYSISAVAIQSSNVLLKIVRFIRFGKKSN